MAAAINVALNAPVENNYSDNSYPSAWLVCFYTWLVFLGMVWVDTVMGGVLVKESRKDTEKGAEDLLYFEWITWAIGGAIPVILGPGLLY